VAAATAMLAGLAGAAGPAAGQPARSAASVSPAAGRLATGASGPSLSVGALPAIVRRRAVLSVSGTAAGNPRAGHALLQAGRPGHWRTVATAAVGHAGRFTIRWRVPNTTPIGPTKVRVASQALSPHPHLLLTTGAVRVTIASAYVGCSPPGVINALVPIGDGLITGGEYLVGGPFPGIDACSSQPYTITATNAAGTVHPTRDVPGGHSYVFIVPAGHYTLRAAGGGCRGTAIVRAARTTHADTICPVP